MEGKGHLHLILFGILVVSLLAILRPRTVYELWVPERLPPGVGARVEALERLDAGTGSSATSLPRLFVIDLDGDGDDDLVHYDGRQRLAVAYRNMGAAGLAALQPAELAAVEAGLGELADRRGGRGLSWDEVRADPAKGDVPRPPSTDHALFFDADGDGDLDVILALPGAPARLELLMRDELGYHEVRPPLGPEWTARQPIADLACGDLNADGLIDLAVAPAESPPVILWNRLARP